MNEFMTSDSELSGDDEAHARKRAAEYAQNTGRPVALWQLVDIVRPGKPQWDSAAPAQPAESEPERIEPGQRVEAIGYMNDDRWYAAEVEKVGLRGGYVRVRYLSGPDFGKTADRLPSNGLRRPSAPAPKPLAFTFGARVRPQRDADGLERDGEWIFVSVENGMANCVTEFSTRFAKFPLDQLTPI